MSTSTTIQLQSGFFTEKERVLVEHGDLSAAMFRYGTGVCGLRLRNRRGELITLPFQGQQVWDCEFEERSLKMRSIFTQPYPTRDYLSTYGGFLLHCGAIAMGVPSKDDTHPLHGELPNAPYQKAYVQVGSDDRGDFLTVGGQYEYQVCFNHHYLFEPRLTLYADAAMFPVTSTLTNLKNTDMEYMYMAHVNFRPMDNGRIVYSAPCTPEHSRVSINVPAHIKSSHPIEEFKAFLNDLKEHPEKHTTLTPDLILDPEVIIFIDYLADADGWAHSLQVHPDGYAHYLAHHLAELPKGVRWMCRTPDHDALGLYLPATAEHKGYLAEKAKGNLKVLPANGNIEFRLHVGLLEPDAAHTTETKIQQILA
jgi:hypothetical protein